MARQPSSVVAEGDVRPDRRSYCDDGRRSLPRSPDRQAATILGVAPGAYVRGTN
jgi:hypothetical protein